MYNVHNFIYFFSFFSWTGTSCNSFNGPELNGPLSKKERVSEIGWPVLEHDKVKYQGYKFKLLISEVINSWKTAVKILKVS